jgi:hypothetical protein
MLFIPVAGLWASSIGVVGLALNLRAYDFVSQELRAAEDAEFESFYTKNILLNEGVRGWLAPTSHNAMNPITPGIDSSTCRTVTFVTAKTITVMAIPNQHELRT